MNFETLRLFYYLGLIRLGPNRRQVISLDVSCIEISTKKDIYVKSNNRVSHLNLALLIFFS